MYIGVKNKISEPRTYFKIQSRCGMADFIVSPRFQIFKIPESFVQFNYFFALKLINGTNFFLMFILDAPVI